MRADDVVRAVLGSLDGAPEQVEVLDAVLAFSGRALGAGHLPPSQLVGVAPDLLLGGVDPVEGISQGGQAPRRRLEVEVGPEQVFLDLLELADPGLSRPRGAAGDFHPPADVVELPLKRVAAPSPPPPPQVEDFS